MPTPEKDDFAKFLAEQATLCLIIEIEFLIRKNFLQVGFLAE